MNNKDFIESHMCTFEPDPIYVELENMLIQYYKDSEHLNNKEAHELWRDLKLCARTMGFTNDEFNKVKRRVQGVNI